MNGRSQFLCFALAFVSTGLLIQATCSAESVRENDVVPTHADAAIILARHSGLFDRYVSRDASLSECVNFLNRNGIYFGLMEVINGKQFAPEDCARVMGQIELVFSGEAEFSAGKVKLPKGIDSWEDFCIMNRVEYKKAYRLMVQTLKYSAN